MFKEKSNMNLVCIIPARMGSSRFPGKPLAKINDKEMILHVMDNCSCSNIIDKVYVATCDQEIFDCIDRNNGNPIMTSDLHERASDRCAEALIKIEELGEKYDYIVMVQGDEPMVKAESIDKVCMELMNDPKSSVANGFGQIDSNGLNDKNTIKVVVDKNNSALFMSRCNIPSNPIPGINVGKQICIIPFKSSALKLYSTLKPTPLEIAESVDMNRFLENGYKVKMVPISLVSHAVDNFEDIKIVEEFMNSI
tara:strand:+ start:1122 stop:1877 length:756 start_codon:yes stop_codon:yes gene_type:complete